MEGVPIANVVWGYTDEAPQPLWAHQGLHSFNPVTGTIHILLNRNLPADIAELVAAHELQHEVLNRRGFPVCGATKPYPVDLVTHINSALTDPPDNDSIAALGYDSAPLYRAAVIMALHDWEKLPIVNEQDDVDLRWNAVVITNRKAQMTPEEWEQFEPLCRIKTPKAYAIANELIRTREHYGISTPQAVIQTAIEWRSVLRIADLIITTRNGATY